MVHHYRMGQRQRPAANGQGCYSAPTAQRRIHAPLSGATPSLVSLDGALSQSLPARRLVPGRILHYVVMMQRPASVGLIVRNGHSGGTYVHKDIAFKFASSISLEHELYIFDHFSSIAKYGL